MYNGNTKTVCMVTVNLRKRQSILCMHTTYANFCSYPSENVVYWLVLLMLFKYVIMIFWHVSVIIPGFLKIQDGFIHSQLLYLIILFNVSSVVFEITSITVFVLNVAHHFLCLCCTVYSYPSTAAS
jgi:hypothetical protein